MFEPRGNGKGPLSVADISRYEGCNINYKYGRNTTRIVYIFSPQAQPLKLKMADRFLFINPLVKMRSNKIIVRGSMFSVPITKTT